MIIKIVDIFGFSIKALALTRVKISNIYIGIMSMASNATSYEHPMLYSLWFSL